MLGWSELPEAFLATTQRRRMSKVLNEVLSADLACVGSIDAEGDLALRPARRRLDSRLDQQSMATTPKAMHRSSAMPVVAPGDAVRSWSVIHTASFDDKNPCHRGDTIEEQQSSFI
jgi:hypothetical protein